MKTLDLGAVSAYAMAVEQGYQGTEKEFRLILANAANYAAESRMNKEAAETAAGEAAGSAQAAEGYKTAAGKILEDVHTEGTTQIQAIEAAGTEQIQALEAKGTEQIQAIELAGAEQTEAAKAEIDAKGKETLDSIPEDYTGLQGEVDELKKYLADKETQDWLVGMVSRTQLAANFFTTHRTGKEFGVKFADFAVSPSPVGTRTRNAVGMTATPSTDTEEAQNDFDAYAIFNGLRVNGHVEADGEFTVDYFAGESGYSETENDTWMLFGTHWFRYDFSDGEECIITDCNKSAFMPEGAAIRPDGSIRPFVAIACYGASAGGDGKAASVSGKMTYYNMSHNNNITYSKAKGTQYCMSAQQDKAHMDMLFLIAFATRNTQSVMQGCTNYNYQYAVAAVESDVERVIVTDAQAANFIAGSCVSVGDKTTNSSLDRGNSYMHNIVNRKVITRIESLGDGNSAIYINNGTAFSTTATTYISSMPWWTGATDKVLGSCGSPISNTSGKTPYKLFGVECAWGQYEAIGNAVMKITAGVMKPYICYDSTLLSTGAPTADYEEVGFSIANSGASWKYVSVMGYDENHPSVRYGIEVAATSSTGYADAQYTENFTESLNAVREILVGGSLDYGAGAGRFFAGLHHGLGFAYWYFAARLSASGRCGRVAA